MATQLSVCMATRNGSRFIREQLDSIIPQLGPDDELVVSDDGSSDATCDIVGSYGEDRVRILTGSSFGSPIRNFEHALHHCRGDIIVLSDQDDIWLPGRLELIRRHLSGKTGTAALIMMDGELVDAAGKSLGTTLFKLNRAGPGILKNIFDNTYTGCCLAFTRPLLLRALPFPAKIPMHDMWLGLLAEIFGSVEFVPVVTIRYRRHGANTSFRRAGVAEQIARRLFLTVNLLKRCLQVRFAGHGRP